MFSLDERLSVQRGRHLFKSIFKKKKGGLLRDSLLMLILGLRCVCLKSYNNDIGQTANTHVGIKLVKT